MWNKIALSAMLLGLFAGGCSTPGPEIIAGEEMRLEIFDSVVASHEELVLLLPATTPEAINRRDKHLATLRGYQRDYKALSALTLRYLRSDNPLANSDELSALALKLVEAWLERRHPTPDSP